MPRAERVDVEQVENRRARSLAPATRLDVQLIEQADTARVPDVGPDADECDSECWAAREHGEHGVAGEERGESFAQYLGARRGCVELGVEVVEQPSDLGGIADVGQARSVSAIHVDRG